MKHYINWHIQLRKVIHDSDPCLEFYEHIRLIIKHKWNTMNTPFHRTTYALNPKWYAARPGKVPPSNDEMKKGLMRTLEKNIY